MGVTGTGGIPLSLDKVVEKLDGTFDYPLKSLSVLLRSCEFHVKL